MSSWNAGPSFFGSDVSHQVRSAFRSLGSVAWLVGAELPQPAAASARARAAATPAVRMRIVSPVDEGKVRGSCQRAALHGGNPCDTSDVGTLARTCRDWKTFQRLLQIL